MIDLCNALYLNIMFFNCWFQFDCLDFRIPRIAHHCYLHELTKSHYLKKWVDLTCLILQNLDLSGMQLFKLSSIFHAKVWHSLVLVELLRHHFDQSHLHLIHSSVETFVALHVEMDFLCLYLLVCVIQSSYASILNSTFYYLFALM